MEVSKVAKTIVAAVGAAISALTIAMGDDTITATEAITAGLALLTALGVYVVPNAPSDTTTVTIDRTAGPPIDPDTLPRDPA
ncbi:MAG: hypothetical protein ACRD0P_08900 [Stackebrandtia sp.]